MAKLFGFKIEKDDEQAKNVVSPVPQTNEDSSDYYVSSGFYGQYVPRCKCVQSGPQLLRHVTRDSYGYNVRGCERIQPAHPSRHVFSDLDASEPSPFSLAHPLLLHLSN